MVFVISMVADTYRCDRVISVYRRDMETDPVGQHRGTPEDPDSPARKIWVWVVASLLCFAVKNLLYFLSTLLAPHITPNAAMVFSVFWAIAIAILILLLIFILPDVLPGYGTLAGIGGGVLGWLLGMYISPQGTSEQVQFAKIGTAIVALFSGYTLKVVNLHKVNLLGIGVSLWRNERTNSTAKLP